MDKQLPFLNWSLKKAVDSEPDSLAKAQIRILSTVLVFSLLKAAIVIGISAADSQRLQAVRAIAAFVVYVSIFKVLLYQPSRIKLLAHIMIVVGILIVWTNIFIYSHKINLVSTQFIFMVVISSFYILSSRWGIAYSIISILPVMFFLIFQGEANISIARSAQELRSPGYEIIVLLNFITVIIMHYLFYGALKENIKEKENLNNDLQLSVAEAHKLAETRANFLSTISHELRTPLNSVVGIAELLIEDRPEERQKENLKILQYSALDLLSLINNVLDFNKIDSEMLVLETTPFRLIEFMENICLGLRIKANDKQLRFILNIDEQLKKTTVLSDPTRLSQLIYNLVSNAIKFTEKGSITMKLECVGKTENGVDVLFSVTDTGIGIHPDRHKTIFDVFSQAESYTTRKYGGTGLGLAIVKQVLALFNSSIQMESSPGNGSRFFFTIPFTTTEEVIEIKTYTAPDKIDFSNLKIMVAEDNILNRIIVKKQFEIMKVNPVIVENGKEAYEEYMAGNFDAIFIDLHMPVLDGYQTARQIRANTNPAKANVYLVAFTASVNEQEKISDYGFDDYLYKPLEMNTLRDKLKEIALHKHNPAVDIMNVPS